MTNRDLNYVLNVQNTPPVATVVNLLLTWIHIGEMAILSMEADYFGKLYSTYPMAY